VRPVNLLPQNARPYQATGKGSGGSYVVIGVLAVLVLAVAAYVMTTNKITSRTNQITKANNEATQSQARSVGLQKYAGFSQVAAARVASVGSKAVSRIDYERLLRETARVLPAGVWVNSLDAESNAPTDATTTPSTPAAGTTTPTGPSVHLLGCAKTQDDVATTMVRLRALHGSDDVQLNDSGKPLPVKGVAQASAGCVTQYAFDILVTLTTDVTGAGDLGKKVPTDLGGGS
jgi:Tfp pilus assembly protein PilN